MPTNTMPVLSLGSTGDAVNLWQIFLKLKPIDGVFGPITKDATMFFQQTHGVAPADGVVASATWDAAKRVRDAETGKTNPHTGGIGQFVLIAAGGALLTMMLGGKKRHHHARR
jgi:peptidoglycan hydrolase-like protein with peptidoglycan-binding domain